MKYLNKFFSDFVNLSKPEFFRKYVFPPVIVFSLWLTIISLYELRYRKNELNVARGRITKLEVIGAGGGSHRFDKPQNGELRIFLENFPAYFRLTDQFNYSGVLRDLRPGDSVAIYYRRKLPAKLGFGRQEDIYQLEQGQKILFDLRQRKSVAKGIAAASLLAAAAFSLIIFFRYRRRPAARPGISAAGANL